MDMLKGEQGCGETAAGGAGVPGMFVSSLG